MYQKIAKSITIGHSQHGKSTIAGILFLSLINRYIKKEKNKRLVDSVFQNVKTCMNDHSLNKNLRYALIYDGLRGDLYQDNILKTFTTRPYTLEVKSDSQILELTDLPGHQHFIRKVCGSVGINDIGIFVVDTLATCDSLLSDPNCNSITESKILKNDPNSSIHKGHSIAAYRESLDRQRIEYIKKEGKRKIKGKTVYERLSNKMHPSVLAGIYNYFFLSLHLGITKFIFCVHKMDSVDFHEDFFIIVKNFIEKLTEMISKNVQNAIDIEVVPTAVEFSEIIEEDIFHNIVEKSNITDWYKGKTVIECFDSYKIQSLKSYENLANDEPVRFQIDTSQTRPYKKRPSKQAGGHFRPYIHGYLHTGIINKGDSLKFLIKGKKEYCDPIRISFDSKNNRLESLYPGRHHTIYLNNNDVKKYTKTRGDNKITAFFSGNFVIKEGEETKNPIEIAQKLKIGFTFVGGWKFIDIFYANFIYGSWRSHAKYTVKHIENDSVSGYVELAEPLPFCSLSLKLYRGKFTIEKNTFVIGVGSILELLE